MATAAVALSLVLGGCGGSSSTTPTPPPEPPEPMPESVSMMLELSETAQSRLKAIDGLGQAGDSDMIEIPAGGMVTVGGTPGVTFTCQSMYACTVTVTNSLGNIEAKYETMMMAGGDAPMVMASAPIPRMAMDVAGANRVNAAALHNLIEGGDAGNGVLRTNVGFFEPATTGTDTQAARDLAAQGTAAVTDTTPSAVHQAMVKKLMRADTEDMEGATFELTGDLVEAIGDATADTGAHDDEPIIKSTVVVSDTMPDNTDPAGERLVVPDAGADGLSTDLSGLRLHQLERDWSHRLPDEPADAPLYGGFETNALIFENIGTDKMRAFEKMFDLNADGMLVNVSGNPMSNLANDHSLAEFMYDGAMGTSQNRKEPNEHFRGTFAGVAGNFQCATAATPCWLVMDDKGTVSVVNDATGVPSSGDTIAYATLSFTPDDPKAMASVPDWTYMALGVWMTTPATKGGLHSAGIVDQVGGLASAIAGVATPGSYNINALTGKATYKGAAVGYYAKTNATGAFTAAAELTADFGEAVGEADNLLSGQISNFHDANGKAMDEMVVDLDAAGAANVSATGGATGTTSGHANGVMWSGNWRAQLSGAPDDKVTELTLLPDANVGTVQATIMDAEASDYPLGVVGAFDAHNTTIAVTGAFGASLQSDDE